MLRYLWILWNTLMAFLTRSPHSAECLQKLANYETYKNRKEAKYISFVDQLLCKCEQDEVQQMSTINELFTPNRESDEKFEIKLKYFLLTNMDNISAVLENSQGVISMLINKNIADNSIEIVLRQMFASNSKMNAEDVVALILHRPSFFPRFRSQLILTLQHNQFDFLSIGRFKPELLLLLLKSQFTVTYYTDHLDFLIRQCGCDVNYVNEEITDCTLMQLALQCLGSKFPTMLLCMYNYDARLLGTRDVLLAIDNNYYAIALEIIKVSAAEIMFARFDVNFLSHRKFQTGDVQKLIDFIVIFHKLGYNTSNLDLSEFKCYFLDNWINERIAKLHRRLHCEKRVKPLKVLAAEKYRRQIASKEHFQSLISSSIDDEIKRALKLEYIFET